MRRWLLPAGCCSPLLIGALAGRLPRPGRSPTCSASKSFLVPSPAEIASSLWENRSLLAENAWVTLREILLGFAAALVVGVALRRPACTSRRLLRDAAYPLIVASQTIPIVVIAPILVVWFGYGIGPKVVDRRADLLLPDHRQHRSTACARSTPRRSR